MQHGIGHNCFNTLWNVLSACLCKFKLVVVRLAVVKHSFVNVACCVTWWPPGLRRVGVYLNRLFKVCKSLVEFSWFLCFFFRFLCLNCFSRKTWYLALFCFYFWWSKLRMPPHHSKSGTHLKSPSKMQVRLDTWFMLESFFLNPDVVIFPGQAQQYLSCRCALKTCEKFPTISDCATPWTNIGHHSRCYVAFFCSAW